MEQKAPQNRPRWKWSWWTRAVAAFLAVAMALSLFLTNAVQIKLGSGDQSASTDVLDETTDYVQKSGASRAGDVLANLVTTPKTLQDYYRNASIQIGQAKYADALASIKSCLALSDGAERSVKDELWLKCGALETLTHAYDDALKSFTHITTGAYRGEQLLIKAQIFDAKKDTEAVCAMLHEYVRLYPGEWETRMTLAASYVQLERYDAAIEQYDAVIDAGKDSGGTAYMQRATARMMAGDYAASIEDFLAAKNAGYSDPSACLAQCALASYLQKDYKAVLGYGARAVAIGSKNFTFETLNYYMGLSQLNLGSYKEAVGLLTNAIDQGVKMDDAYYYRGACYMVNGSMEDAVKDFTTVIERNVTSLLSNSYFNRGVCEADLKLFDQAKADLQKVMELEQKGELYESAKTMLGLL